MKGKKGLHESKLGRIFYGNSGNCQNTFYLFAQTSRCCDCKRPLQQGIMARRQGCSIAPIWAAAKEADWAYLRENGMSYAARCMQNKMQSYKRQNWGFLQKILPFILHYSPV